MNPTVATQRLADILSADDILLGVHAAHKFQLFDQVAGHLSRRHPCLNGAQVCRLLAEREKLGSTGLGQGVAIPHARIPGLHEAHAAFARPQSPLAFDAPDGKPVQAVLILLVPEQANEQHLHLLSQAAQMLCNKGFREQLRACHDAASVYALLTQQS